jgi:hypothetical protein
MVLLNMTQVFQLTTGREAPRAPEIVSPATSDNAGAIQLVNQNNRLNLTGRNGDLNAEHGACS